MPRLHTAPGFALVFAIVAAIAAPGVFAQDAAGTYVGELMGAPIEVVLEPGGAASVEGQPASWHLEGEQLLLVGPEGHALIGELSGNELTLHLDGEVLELRRTSAGAEGQLAGRSPNGFGAVERGWGDPKGDPGRALGIRPSCGFQVGVPPVFHRGAEPEPAPESGSGSGSGSGSEPNPESEPSCAPDLK